MDDDNGEDKDGRKGQLITFPNGKAVTSGELGTPFVAGQGGQVPTAELLDPREVKQEYRDREEFVRSHELVKAVERGAETHDMITGVLKEITEELAHLKWERQKAAKEGKNTANYTIGRVAALRQLADVLLKRQEGMRAEQLDLKSERFKAVLGLWMSFVYETMLKCGHGEKDIDVFFNIMKADMLEWEKRILEATG